MCEVALPDGWSGVDWSRADVTLLGCYPNLLDSLEMLADPPPAARSVPVLLLMDRLDPHLATYALERGAEDVLPPPHCASAILLRAQLAKGVGRATVMPRAGTHRALIQLGQCAVDVEGRRIVSPSGSIILTRREAEVLGYLGQAGGRTVPKRDLLRGVWGDDEPVSSVLESTIHRLRKKLEPDPARPMYLRTVYGLGYQLESNTVDGT